MNSIVKKKIAIGADHAGFELKQKIVEMLKSLSYEVIDFGTNNLDSVDYPLIAKDLANSIKNKNPDKGILICGTGIGMAIAANKIKGVLAANCMDEYTAKMSRSHNNSNILTLGSRIIDEEKAKSVVKTWLESEFEGGRHLRRVQEIKDLEK